MTSRSSNTNLEVRAIQALSALLKQVSVIRVKEIRLEDRGPGKGSALVALLDVLGQSHTLACEVEPNDRTESLCSAMDAGCDSATETHIVIAPHMSSKAQEFCKRNHAGFLDLDGNARIDMGEVFIGRRCVARHSHACAANHTTAPG